MKNYKKKSINFSNFFGILWHKLNISLKIVHLSEVKRTNIQEEEAQEVQCYYCSKMFMNTDVGKYLT